MYKLTDKKKHLLQMKDNIILAYTWGNLSLREVAKIYETSPGSIRALLIEEGIKMRERGRRKKEN